MYVWLWPRSETTAKLHLATVGNHGEVASGEARIPSLAMRCDDKFLWKCEWSSRRTNTSTCIGRFFSAKLAQVHGTCPTTAHVCILMSKLICCPKRAGLQHPPRNCSLHAFVWKTRPIRVRVVSPCEYNLCVYDHSPSNVWVYNFDQRFIFDHYFLQ